MLNLYNSLSKKEEEVKPIHPPQVSVYTCGPTVYNYPTIGNWRTYTLSDLVLRTLKYDGYEIDFIMNITDVGHLTGDNEGDADTGQDRLEKAAKRESKTAWEVAEYYSNDFVSSYKLLNLTMPRRFVKATEHIPEQVKLVKKLEENGFTYKTRDGIYFDVPAYETAGFRYGELSDLDQRKEGARVDINPDKKDPRDFALWKFSPPGVKRDMEWDSPWGKGFPGWHIECSAMSMKYLGEQFDIHVGGIDLKSTHHPNEIAQSEGATAKHPFVRYWVHGAFLLVDGKRMGKSLGNAYTLADITARKFSPLDLRYFYLTSHYRKTLNFTWEALAAAQSARTSLLEQMHSFNTQGHDKRTVLSADKLEKVNTFRTEFTNALNNDLNLPQALAVVWETVKSNIPGEDKYDLLMSFDQVLGIGMDKPAEIAEIPESISTLIQKRNEYRNHKQFDKADEMRKEIEKAGYSIEDRPNGTLIRKIQP